MTEPAAGTTTARTDPNGSDAENTTAELSKFQVRILAVIAAADQPPKGVRVMELLRDYYQTPINHGRLYPNLDDLVEDGLLDKSERDKRTNEYTLTDAGRTALETETRWLLDRVFPDAGHEPEGSA